VGQLTSYRVFQTIDIDEGQQFAGRVWERNRTTVTDGDYGLRWNYLSLSQTDFSYVEQDAPARLEAEGPLSDHFRLYLQRRGAIEHNVNNRQFLGDASHLVAHAPGIDLKAKLFPFDLLIVGFSGSIVRDALRQRFRRFPPPQDWVGALPVSPCTEALRSSIDWLTTELDRPGSPLSTPGNPRSFAERTLLSLFIEALAEIAPGEAEPALDVGEAHVRRAEAWIDANLAEPIGVHEMASAVGTGARSLQLTFRRLRGCTPSEAITQRRLEAARRLLLHADGDATVTQIATDMGFYELSRFSRRYREHFGERPSTTLARCTGTTRKRKPRADET
jgi:AraC-like DNA-binding protein